MYRYLGSTVVRTSYVDVVRSKKFRGGKIRPCIRELYIDDGTTSATLLRNIGVIGHK